MKLKRLLSALLVTACLLFAHNAWATHAYELTGVGPKNLSMSGAGVAAPLDTFTIETNPAGLVKVTDRADFATVMGIPLGQMDTSAAPNGNAAAGNQKNKFEIYPLPYVGTVWGFLDDRLAIGFAFYQYTGASGTYDFSRANPALTGNNFDTYIDYKLFKIVPAVAYQILDNLSIGVGIQVGFAMFGTDSLITSSLQQTSGRGRTDNAFGLGGKIGFLYEPIPELALGVAYSSMMGFQKFDLYDDLTRGRRVNTPHEVKAGLAGWPFPQWLLALDFKWINWSGVDLLGDAPDNGGLGWRDMYIVQFGTQYTIKKKIHLRAGYTWGRSPITSDVVFANAFVPVIAEHNASAGVGVDVSKNVTLDLAYSIAIPRRLTQSTGGGSLGAAGAGTKVRYTGHAIGFGASYNWGNNKK
jgi:long-chain fatty acid transport protein